MRITFYPRRVFIAFLIVATAAVVALATSGDAQAGHGDGGGNPLPHASVKIWNVQPLLGNNPDDSVEDVAGLTVDVATVANPLTIATAWENTFCPGGPCGAMLWNPATDDFQCWGITGGFTASIDVNTAAPVLTDAAGRTYQPGDTWVGGPNSAPLYVKFKGAASARIWFPSGNVWDVMVDQGTGDVWFSSPFDGSINRLNPATNTHTKWTVGGKVRELAQDSGGQIYATAGLTPATPATPGTSKIVRLDPATNAVREWAVPGGGLFSGSSIFATPDGIHIDADGNVWFTESVSSEIGRLNPTTDVISEFTKAGLSNPQLIATSGSGGLLQAFFTEGSGNAVSLLTQVEAVGTDTAVAPVDTFVTPTTPSIPVTDRALKFKREIIPPDIYDVPGVDGGPDALGTTKTSGPDGIPGNADDERIPGILRFPMGGTLLPVPPFTGNSFPSGMTGVASPNTVYGAFLFSSRVFELTSDAIIAPPPRDEIEVPVDVKPQSCRNPLNTGNKGVLPVAILGTGGFDVSQVDPTTIELEGVSPLRWALEDVATPFSPFVGKKDAFDCTDEGADGFTDLTLKFDSQAIVGALGAVSDGDVLVLSLTGSLKPEFGGTPIVGEDVVVILKKGKK